VTFAYSSRSVTHEREFSSAARPRGRAPRRAEPEVCRRLIIPDTAKEKPSEGQVLASGPGARDERGELVPLTVKPGDRILFGKWSGTEVKLDGEELLIMKETDILGIVESRQSGKKAA
jgi:chaperonin GroES